MNTEGTDLLRVSPRTFRRTMVRTVAEPSLYLDFTVSNQLDPRITFTRASSATFFDSAGVLQTAASDAARFTYNPSTLAAQGLLIEEQRTNSFLQSQFASGWLFSNASFTSTTIAPDGTNTGQVLNDSSAAAAGYVYQGVSVTSGTAYAFSVFAKSAGLTSITLRNFTQAGAVAFNLTGSGSAETPTGTFSSPAITAVGNGWYRCSVIFTATGTASNNIAFVANPIAFTGEAFAIWGAQLEAGAFPTSYIPTTTTALTRNADVASMTGTNFSSWFNASQGTVLCAATRPSSGQPYLWMFSNGATASERYYLRYVATQYQFIPRASGVDGAGAYVSAASALLTARHATAYVSNQNRISSNGLQDGNSTVTVTSQPTSLDTLYLGSFTGTGSFLNGTIQRLAFYPVALPNAQLVALTG
jgi:hypothetical protein